MSIILVTIFLTSMCLSVACSALYYIMEFTSGIDRPNKTILHFIDSIRYISNFILFVALAIIGVRGAWFFIMTSIANHCGCN